MTIKINSVEVINNELVTPGIFILIPINQKQDPFGSGPPNYFIVSDTEELNVGDPWIMLDKQIMQMVYKDQMYAIASQEDVDAYQKLKASNKLNSGIKKIIVLPEHFPLNIKEDIISGRLKNWDNVYVDCEYGNPSTVDNSITFPLISLHPTWKTVKITKYQPKKTSRNEAILNLKYPEHEKLDSIKEQSQQIGEFLEWLNSKGLRLGKYEEDVFVPHYQSTTTILSEYFNINQKILENEKTQMLKELKKLNSK